MLNLYQKPLDSLLEDSDGSEDDSSSYSPVSGDS